MSTNDRPPRVMDAEEDTFPARTDYDGTVMLRRGWVEGMVRDLAPYGRYYLLHCIYNVRRDDFMAACRHFGLDHLVVDFGLADVGAEMRARRARGAPPTDRPRPKGPLQGPREFTDAMLDVYERKVAEATAARAAGARAAAPAA